MTGIADNRNW